MNKLFDLRYLAILAMFAISQPGWAQSPDLVCTEAARTLVDGSRSQLDNPNSSRSGAQSEIRWSTHEGHKGICRVDAQGRVYEIAITEFPPSPGYEYSLTCSSERFARKDCALKEAGTARLERQLSNSRCTENQTWGVTGRTLWVDKGCSARFTITTKPAWEPYTLSCESLNNRRSECKLKGPADVSISRQLSSTYCRLDTNWGVQNDKLWVDKGCRAVFRVSMADTTGTPTNVRTAAIRACESLARSRDYLVLNARVLEAESGHVDVELMGERNRVMVDLFCRYDTASGKANIYGG